VLAGDDASPSQLRRFAPSLGWRAADLFVAAGLDVPDDLAAAAGTTPWEVGSVVKSAASLPSEQRRRLHEFVRSLPTRLAVQPPAAWATATYPLGPGALLLGS
jgi:FAD/FMN-containing dehydrogenase